MRPPQPSTYFSSLLLVLVAGTTISALKLTFVPPPNIPSNFLSSTTSASLISAHQAPYTAPIQRAPSNGFTFRNLTTGSFLLQVHSPEWAFAPLRVDVRPSRVPATSSVSSGDGGGVDEHDAEKRKSGFIDAGVRGGVDVLVHRTFLGNAWDERGELKGKFVAGEDDDDGSGGVVAGGATSTAATTDEKNTARNGERELKIYLDVLGRKEYYSAREGFSPLSLFRNPMILLAGVSLVLVFGMPYLIDNMDPEMRAEFEEQQRKGGALGLLAGGGSSSSGAGRDGGATAAAAGGEEGETASVGAGTSAVNALQGFDLAGWMAGQTTSSSSSSAAAAARGSTSKEASQGGNPKSSTSGGDKGSGQSGGKVRRRG